MEMFDEIPDTQTSPVPGSSDPPKDSTESALWDWLDTAALEAERVRRREARLDEFNDFLDIFYGKHWPSSLPSFRPPIVINELRTLLLAEASDLSDSNLRIYITKDPKNGGRDEALERAFKAVWAANEIDLQFLYSTLWALICGTGFLEVGWDIDLYHGMGDVFVESRDPRTVLPDPDAIDDKKWLFVITETILDIQTIRRLFPVKGRLIEPEDRYSTKEPSGGKVDGPQTSIYSGPLYERGGLPDGRGIGYKKQRARLLDCIVIDDSIESVVEEEITKEGKKVLDENGNPKMRQYDRKKYPNGRRIVGCNGIILLDGACPHPGDRDFGLLRVVLEPTLDRFWGSGFVQQTSQLQLAANKLMSSVVENSIRLNNGIVIAEGNTGLDFESFAGIPAQVLQINQGSGIKIQYPPPMPPDMVQAPWKMLDLQKRLLGHSEARSGAPSRGNVSAELTETEISQSQSPTRLRSRLLYNVVKRLAEMIFARMAYGYQTERIIPTIDGEDLKPVTWKPLENPQDYKIYVDPASFQVMSKTMLKRLGVALYKLKAIDRESLLETLNWPEAKKTAKRLAEQEKLAAMAKMQQKQRGGKR